MSVILQTFFGPKSIFYNDYLNGLSRFYDLFFRIFENVSFLSIREQEAGLIDDINDLLKKVAQHINENSQN